MGSEKTGASGDVLKTKRKTMICPKCGKKLGKNDSLTELGCEDRSTGKMCGKCWDKVIKKILEQTKTGGER